MTANVVPPAELERMLQARVDAARKKRERAGKSDRTRSGRVRRGTLALIAGTMLALSAAAVWASHPGSPYIDLTADDTVLEHHGAIFTQGGFGSGTGNFDPFLTLQPGGSVQTEAGFNLCSEPVFGFTNASITCPSPTQENQGGDRTHELRASSVPAIDVGGTLYREFFLDSNDQGGEPFMSIQVIRLYLDSQPDLTYNPTTDTFTGNTGAAPSLLWDLDGDGNQTILMNTQGLESGSGVSDISVLVPDSLFPANCFYGSTTCNLFIYFGTIAGDPNLVVPGHPGKNWNTTAGFEEWSTELLPVVNVAKTVDIAFDRTFPWDVAKEADGEPDHIDLFAGDTATIDWTVTATVGTPTESDATITGDIVITNPTGGAIPAIEATVEDVEDVLTLGGTPHDATVTCPDDFPFDIAAGGSVTCTYSFDPDSTDNGTNEATVTLGIYDKQDLVETIEYSDTETVDFADADINEIDECIEVTDDNATPGDTSDDLVLDEELCEDESPGVYQFSTDVGPFDVEDCGQVTITNRAETVTNDTETEDSATDSVTVSCYELTVTKNANEELTRTFPWNVEKSANVETIDLFAGETATIDWTVTATVGAAVDSGFAVSGTITLSNPAPMIADDVSVADVLTGGLNATVDCDAVTMGSQTTVDVPAATMGGPGTATCSYSRSLPDDADRTNTATATLFDEDYSGTAPVDFDEAVITEVDECIEVTDDNATPGDTSDDTQLDAELCEDESPGVYEFSTDVGPFDVEECGQVTITNRAETVTNDTETEDSATDSVIVDCYELTVEKNAIEELTRTYTWNVDKEADGEPDTIHLNAGDTATINWTVSVEVTGSSDSGHKVSGTITITNPAPMAAEDVEVTDVISHAVDPDIAGTVDCDPGAGTSTTVDIPAAVMGTPGSASCTYSADLPNADDRLNTATATLFEIGYDGTANIDFDGATVHEVDECVVVTDDNLTPGDISDDELLDPALCVGEAPEDYPSSNTVGPFTGDDCTTGSVTNTGHIVTNDTETPDSDPDTVTFTCHEPTVTKTATGTFDRTWTWTIEKSGSQTEVTLDQGATTTVSYDVTLDATSADDGHEVHGTITITNPNPEDSMTVDVTDALDTGDSLAATDIACDDGADGDGEDVVVPASDSVDCTYSFALLDDSATLNTATATLNGTGYDGSDAVEWALDQEIDECVDVSDTLQGDLGEVCADDVPVTIEYDRQIGPYPECGDFTVTNVASFLTNDTDTSDDDTWTVIVHVVNCGEGCTPGFWQGGFGAQLWNSLNDPQWVANGGDGTNPFIHTTLFNDFFTDHASLDGKTMIQIVGTGGGNAWPRKAARDVVAAYLNASFGLDYPHTPAQIAAMWTAAVNQGGNAGFQAIHADLGVDNTLGCDIPPTASLGGPSTATMIPILGIAGLVGGASRRFRRR